MFLPDAALARSIVDLAMQILHTGVSELAQENLQPRTMVVIAPRFIQGKPVRA